MTINDSEWWLLVSSSHIDSQHNCNDYSVRLHDLKDQGLNPQTAMEAYWMTLDQSHTLIPANLPVFLRGLLEKRTL